MAGRANESDAVIVAAVLTGDSIEIGCCRFDVVNGPAAQHGTIEGRPTSGYVGYASGRGLCCGVIITKLFEHAVDASPDKAAGTIRFKNIDRATTVVLDLVKIKSDWRVANITWRRERRKKETLRGLYRH